MTKLALIVAMDENGLIGSNSDLPWRLPEDLKKFKQLTMGHPMIMGRKTFESIGRVLPGRPHIIVSRNPNYQAEGTHHAKGVEEALQLARELDPVKAFVIGGGEIYRELWPYIDEVYVTLVKTKAKGDTYFPIKNLFEKVDILDAEEGVSAGEAKLPYCFYHLRPKPSAKRVSGTSGINEAHVE